MYCIKIANRIFRTKAPWTAAIFLKGKSGFQFLLGGTILSPTVVLSVLGGAYGTLPRGAKGRYGLFKPETLRVGAGLLSGNIDHVDSNSQIAEVFFIVSICSFMVYIFSPK